MAEVLYDRDADLSLLKGKKIAILGYGSQGHAHAQNLRDSGMDVIIGLYEGSKSWEIARKDGFEVYTVGEATKLADIVMFLLPDHLQGDVYKIYVRGNLKPGMAIGFSHGFAVHFHQVEPPKDVDVFMVAPKGPGHLVRRMFKEGRGVPALLAVYQDATGKAKELGLAYASAIGAGRAGVIWTTFAEETETDLFGEQAVLCGGVTELVKAGFEILVEAGYQPEIAYFECLNELKLIVDLMYEGGISWMRYSVSDTAKYGDMIAGSYVINEDVKKRMKELLKRVKDGSFAKDWILENQCGRPRLKTWLAKEKEHLIEKVGAKLREMMPWLENRKPPA
ncbi:MAG: ketol-acid reductoisomerase [Synergistetes bacterium]|nr:ketol-acid reductoisomerase [Synergistota bacterium]MCD6363177.1 ketol-acid reductoisomerase [Synergistota bacterium]